MSYWKDRSLQKLTEAEQYSLGAQKQIALLLKEAKKKVDRQINEVYLAYSNKTGLAVDELAMVLNHTERANFVLAIKAKMQELAINFKDVYHEGYLARLSRLDALREQIYWEMVKLAPKEIAIMEETFSRVARQNYNDLGLEFKRFNIPVSFSQVDTNIIEQVLSRKWYGSNFSTRVWKNTEELARNIWLKIGGALSVGQSYQKTMRDIRGEFRVETYQAMRLVRTETNFILNQSTLARYKSVGIRYYQYLADLEGNICSVCRDLNGSVHKVNEAMTGDNYPPIHPNCRCTTVALFEEDKLDLEKIKESEGKIRGVAEDLDFITARPNKNSRHIYYFPKDATAQEITEELGTDWVSKFVSNPNN